MLNKYWLVITIITAGVIRNCSTVWIKGNCFSLTLQFKALFSSTLCFNKSTIITSGSLFLFTAFSLNQSATWIYLLLMVQDLCFSHGSAELLLFFVFWGFFENKRWKTKTVNAWGFEEWEEGPTVCGGHPLQVGFPLCEHLFQCGLRMFLY